MPTLKYLEPADDTYRDLAFIARGPKGDKGDPGGSTVYKLDDLNDVAAPAGTPPGKVLGTTGVGTWGPVDDVVVRSMLVRGVLLTEGVDVGGRKVSSVADPTAPFEGANKRYVDSRIWTGTQAQYDALPLTDPTVLYVVAG